MIQNRCSFLLVLFLCFALSMDGATKRFTIVIDAGHGGKDTGAKGKSVYEKTLTLRYANAFGRIIEQNCPDVKVIYTRKTDRFCRDCQQCQGRPLRFRSYQRPARQEDITWLSNLYLGAQSARRQ